MSRWRPWVLLCVALLLAAPEVHADPPPVGGYSLSGTEALGAATIRRRIGKAPSDAKAVDRWGQRAARRVEQYYRRKGYWFARVSFGRDEQGLPRFDVDEGVIHSVVFHGTSIYNSARFRVLLDLPHRAFHAGFVRRALEQLAVKYGLVGATYRVDEADDGIANSVGVVVPTRTLHIHPAPGSESFGFSFGAALNATYGLLPEANARLADVIATGDRLRLGLGVGVPYRRYLFDAEPKFQWVHGVFDLGYRLPPFLEGHWAPGLDTRVAVSDDGRPEVSPEAYYTVRTDAFATLAYLDLPLVVTLGLGVRHHRFFLLTPADPPHPEVDDERLRYGLRVTVDHVFTPEVARRDLRSTLSASAFAALDDGPGWFTEARFSGQWVGRVGHHDFLVRGDALYVAGDATVVDDAQLSGPNQRVTFGGRYWVRAVGSLELAGRFSLYRDRVKMGLFVDTSLFGDRRNGANLAAAALSVGPSMHFLLFDELGFDLFYGFGFSGEDFADFDHNVSFSLVTVY